MQVIEQQNLLQKVKDDSEFVKQRLLDMKARYPVIGDVRGIGLLWGVELVTDPITKTRAYDEAEALLYQCLNQGLSFKVSQGQCRSTQPTVDYRAKRLSMQP